ncbi:glycosyltransferase [Candidatus Saganbacteria bacterium]|nr:glycosyltransferase [Candidatus Saganbacteria bacterium]
MRIAFFTDSYKPYISGVTISIVTLASELRALGHKVYIVAPSYPGEVCDEKDVIRLPSSPTWYPGFRVALPFVKDLPQVDLVHAHSPFFQGLLARSIARKRKVPIAYTFHTLFTRYSHYIRILPDPVVKFIAANYLRSFCNSIDATIAPSAMSKRVLLSWGIKNRIEVVPSGFDLHPNAEIDAMRSRGKIRALLGIPKDAKVLVCLGRISREKNIPFLVSAFRKLNRENLYLLLIGDGPMLCELKSKPVKNVIFSGGLKHEDALAHCAAGDIFVFASLTETQGLVLAEAKALSLPIVALFAGGLIDTVRSGTDGYLVARNIEAFTSHIERLLNDDKLRKKMGELARVDAHERFSSKAIAKRVETLYNSLIR